MAAVMAIKTTKPAGYLYTMCVSGAFKMHTLLESIHTSQLFQVDSETDKTHMYFRNTWTFNVQTRAITIVCELSYKILIKYTE